MQSQSALRCGASGKRDTAREAPSSPGTGKWNRVLIDATMNLDYDPDPELGGARYPPLVWPAQADIDAAMARWAELGLKKPR